MASTPKITIVTFENAESDLDSLAPHLETTFAAAVTGITLRIDPLEAYDPSRRQYDARHFLTRLEPVAGDRILGITGLDLFIPILTFVFGLARLGGRTAIVSMHRLAATAADSDPMIGGSRLVKEATHELGHCLGLPHCHDHVCVMAHSSIPEEIDLKEAIFCEKCDRWRRARFAPGLR